MLELAAEMQEQECGDATNLTVSFAGELLKMCEDLLRMGLHTSEIVMGYKKAYEFLQKALPELVTETVEDGRDAKEVRGMEGGHTRYSFLVNNRFARYSSSAS